MQALLHARQSMPAALLRLRLWMMTGVLMLFASTGRADPSKEYQVKAAFIYNFTQFVDWPTNAFAETNAPLTIGVLGNDPFNGALEEIVRGETASGHPLAVKHFQSADDIKDCHILFVCPSEAKRLQKILAEVKGRPILTVGETEGFAQAGGMIRFVMEQSKLHLRINADAAQAAHLDLSSRLLRLADIVDTKKE